AAAGSPHYAALALALAIMVGVIVTIAGAARMGWVGDLISTPVMTGFLAGISAHILASQGPAALGLAPPGGSTLQKLIGLVAALPRANAYDAAISIGVLGAIIILERLNRRIPAALIAVGVATLLAITFRLDTRGVAELGVLSHVAAHIGVPAIDLSQWLRLGPLAFLVSAVVIGQTAAVSRAFGSEGGGVDVNGDLIGVGTGNLLAGLIGAFPINASPPRTGIVEESGGRSQVAGLVAVAIVVLLLVFGLSALAHVPTAALAGVLLFVAARLVRLPEMGRILKQSPAEFVLVLVTIGAIVMLPIESGVATGVVLSILHGVWSAARVRVRPMTRQPGTTVWWSHHHGSSAEGERLQGVEVLAYQAPLTFLSADAFAREFLAAVRAEPGLRLVILEAAGVLMIDYTAAAALARVVRECRAAGCDFALARLESPAARTALRRLGLRELIGDDHIFQSVDAATAALAPDAKVAGGGAPA
ncbi:MAG: SulP family inorganic anion transporter, partial [Caulobacteraceae bacterium]|nr:SulP family inorganic anion transporter [Caulobacteraceae bacterium]